MLVSRFVARCSATVLVVASMTLIACGGGESSDEAGVNSIGEASAETTTGESRVEVTEAWARTSPSMTTAGAAYMKIVVPEDDALIDVSVDPSVAAMAQIHETVMVTSDTSTMGTSSMNSNPMGGAMTMQEVDHIDLRGGELLELKPGGYHIMLMELATPLEARATFDLTLSFEKAGDVVVSVEVREDAP